MWFISINGHWNILTKKQQVIKYNLWYQSDDVISEICGHIVCGSNVHVGFSINDVLKIQDDSTLLHAKTCMCYLLAYAYQYMWEIQASLKNALLLWVNTYVAYGSKMVPGVFWVLNYLAMICSIIGKVFIQNLDCVSRRCNK